MTTRSTDLKSDLAQFTGTEVWYRHSINRRVMYSEGVKYFADKAGCYWLLDILATQPEILKQAEEFASIRLQVADDMSANLSVTDGNDTTVYTRRIGFTDCPEGDWEFFFINNVIMLPSEY